MNKEQYIVKLQSFIENYKSTLDMNFSVSEIDPEDYSLSTYQQELYNILANMDTTDKMGVLCKAQEILVSLSE